MAWSFPVPLGTSLTRLRLLYEQWILTKVPPWLRRATGGVVLSSIGEVMDSMIDRLGLAVQLRFPGTDESSLAVVGRERRIVRGPSESALAYAARVRQWRPAHRHRGSVYALLEQWHAYNADAPRRIDVVYNSGTRYVMESDGTITRDILPDWTGDGTGRWARAWCFLYEDADPGPLTAAQEAAYTAIPRLWNAAHMLPLTVVILWPGVGLWDYPPGIWDEGEDWTDDEPIILEAS